MSLDRSETHIQDPKFWENKRVLITGHTGFKGSWLSQWLINKRAKVCGLALEPSTQPNLFHTLNLTENLESNIEDINDLEKVKSVVSNFKPDVVFHLAAQPLVRESYKNPIETYRTNVMGTANLLESLRVSTSVKAIVAVTTDKCYENKEWIYPYRESDHLGGHDPYSSSKACAEILVSTYRSSFFSSKAGVTGHAGVPIATARAGNVIGGGDWSLDRLIPDAVRAFQKNSKVKIRRPNSVRPWQHVLEPLTGYLNLAEKLVIKGEKYAQAYNFGPESKDCKAVDKVLDIFCSHWGSGAAYEVDLDPSPHEAGLLRLDSSLAQSELGWVPKWDLNASLKETAGWYRCFYQTPETIKEFTLDQIRRFELPTSS